MTEAKATTLRERGTLKRTLPNPYIILVLFWLICTGAATYLSYYSADTGTTSETESTNFYLDLALVAIKAGLGVASSTYSILYNDPFIHLISYTLDLLLSFLLDNAAGQSSSSLQKSDLQALAPAVIVFILSQLKLSAPALNFICNGMENEFFINSFNLMTWSLGPLIMTFIGASYMMVSTLEITYTYPLLFAPSIFFGIATLFVCYKFYQRRVHKSGNLTLGQMGRSVLVGIIIVATTLSLAKDTTRALNMIPFLLGSVFATGAAASFAGVADVWYAVGTGQWQMVSLDTAGIMFYFALPLWVLTLRFFVKYGDFVTEKVTMVMAGDIVRALDLKSLMEQNEEIGLDEVVSYAYVSLVAFLSIVTGIGVPLVKSLCPFNGYLFGRTFTHGEEYSKTIAIAVNFSDLFHSSITEKEREIVSKSLRKWKKGAKMEGDWGKVLPLVSNGLLTIIVTASDLKSSPEEIKKLHEAGHEIAITVDESANTKSITSAYEIFEKTIGGPPLWYHTGTSSSGSNPACFSTALNLGMRSAMWSIYMNIVDGLSEEQKRAMKSELVRHRGGSIIYLECKSKTDSKASLSGLNDTLALIYSLGEVKLLPTTLSLTITEKNQMDL